MADWVNQLRLGELERQYNLPSNLLASVMRTESAGNPNAVSPKGAQGLFQFMPATAKEMGVNPLDPASSAQGAARMYRNLLTKYNGDIDKSLAAYNWGQGNVDRKGLDQIPLETRNYSQKVRSGMATNPKSSGFDPDAWLAANPAPAQPVKPARGGFDPEAWLAANPAPAAPQLTTGQRVYQAVRPYAAPLLEAGGLIGGGLLGTPMGLAGIVGGAGLGYGAAKEGLELADVAMGMKAPRQGAARVVEPVRNVLEGATFEAGGRVAGPLVAKGVGKLMDLRQIPKNRTATIARNALGPDLDQTVNALRNAPPGASVAEVTANIQNPAWQALIRDGLEKTPQGAQYLNKFATLTHEEGVNALSKLAGGSTAADARAATELAKQTLKDITSPARQASLSRANKGMDVAALEAEAESLAQIAGAKVEDVRRLVKAGNIAEASARLELIKKGLPVGLTKYTYKGEQAKMADDWASQAAEASLDLGQGARFAQSAADSLRSAGLAPLKTAPLIDALRTIRRDPEFAGLDVMKASVDNLSRDFVEWTSSGGIIDAHALDAIRMNSVNAAIQQLRPGMDATSQRNLAAGVLSRVRPVIVDAVEAAGGKGYREYLDDYAEGMQYIAKQKLSGEALRLFKNDKDAFVRLVQNESPDVVEKILGPGKYNIAVELAEDKLSVLQAQAERRINQLAASNQADRGAKTLTTLLRENTLRFRLPSWLSFWGAAANKTLSELEKAIGGKSMKVLSTAAQSPQRTADLLESLPAAERNRVLQIMADPSKWGAHTRAAVTGTTTTGVNMLAPDRDVENSFVTD